MHQFRKKSVVIEAFQMTRARCEDNSEWPAWLNEAWNGPRYAPGSLYAKNTEDRLEIGTLEGVLTVDWDEWIICDVRGEIYPCKPDIFAATYEAVKGENMGIADTPLGHPYDAPNRVVEYVDQAIAALGDNLIEVRLECLKLLAHNPNLHHETVLQRARDYADFVIGDTK